MEAITFRAEPEIIEAIRDRAAEFGVSANSMLRSLVAPLVSTSKPAASAKSQRNNLARFCGCLRDVDDTEMREAQRESTLGTCARRRTDHSADLERFLGAWDDSTANRLRENLKAFSAINENTWR